MTSHTTVQAADRRTAGRGPRRLMIPREHGAWAMLLLPFASALALARRLDWEVAPAAVTVVGIFLIREPLVVLWRQARLWMEPRPEAEAARTSLAWYLPAIAIGGVVLLWRLPLQPLLVLGFLAALLLAVSTYLTVQNRRRSLLLQLSSAAGLNLSAIVAWLTVRPETESQLWWLWGLQFAHSGAALLAVHARLEARIAARSGREVAVMRGRAIAAQALLLLGAIACATTGRLGLAVALALSAAVHTADLARLRRPSFLQVPLRHVGLRELSLSVVFSMLVLAGLW